MLEERLREVPFLRGLPPSSRAEIGGRFTPVTVPAGATLFSAGDVSDALYVVDDGWLLVEAAGTGRELAEVGPGSVVGEVGVLLDEPRSATVRAITDCHAFVLARADVDELVAAHPQLALALGREVSQRLRDADARRAVRPPQVVVTRGPDAFTVAGAVAALGRDRVAVLRLDGERDWRDLPDGVGAVLQRHADPEAIVELATGPARDVAVVVVAVPDEPTPAGLAAAEVGDHAVEIDARLPAWALARMDPLRRRAATGRPDHLARVARWVSGRAVGLALSSGGSKTIAHVGVLRVLREAGVTVDAIAGTSGGAVVGASAAFGLSHAELVGRVRELPEAFRYRRLGARVPPRDGLFSGASLRSIFGRWWDVADVGDSPTPLFIVAADVATGDEVVVRSGSVADAVRASMGIPGVFSPVPFDGRWLTDGGIVTPLPARVLRDAGIGVVLASNVAGQELRAVPGGGPPGLVDTLGRIVSTLERQVLAGQVSLADVVIRPVLRASNSFDFGQVDAYLAEGVRAAQAALPAIVDALAD